MTPRRRMLIAAVAAAGVSWLVPWALAPARFHYAPPTATLETAAFAVAAAPQAALAEETEPATPDAAPEETFAEAAPEASGATLAPALPEAPPGASAAAIAPAWDARLAELAGLGELGARAGAGAPDFALPPMPGAPGAAGEGAPAVGDSEGPLLLAPPDLAAHYPYAARLRGTTGATALRLTVSAAGAVTAVEVAESSPPGVFEEAARRLGRALRFRPARANGRPVPARVELRLNWRLDGTSQ